MDYILNKESGGIIITLYGLITGDEIRSLNHKLITSKNFPKWLYQIWDFSKAEQSDLSLADLRSIVFQDTIAADNHPNVKVAIIPRQRKKSGLDHVFHILAKEWGGYESRSFRNVKSARKWAVQEMGANFY